MLWITTRSLPAYANPTWRNSNPCRISLGAAIAPGAEEIVGSMAKNSNRSVRKTACSNMSLKPERIFSMYARERLNGVTAPPSLRATTTT
ncbi:MAG: hypothetical protein ABSC05_30430 [Candidatus Solibacter sp.]|jgi:hypothetical protein